jgi:phosphopentomutase
MLCAKKNAVGRIIARPFIGTNDSHIRMVNRRDYSLTPFEITVLDKAKNSVGDVIATGKIEDIFGGKGITEAVYTEGNLKDMGITLGKVKRLFEKK